MLRSVSIEMMWNDRPYAERATAAAVAGFDLVDLWDWRTSDIDTVAEACADGGIAVNGFFGNRDHGLCDPGVRQECLEEIARSIECAARVKARQLHLFSNAISSGRVVPSPPLTYEDLHSSCIDALREALVLARGTGVTLVLEHLNNVFLPGMLWNDITVTTAVARELGVPGVGVVFDTFHQQLCGGRLTDHLRSCVPWLARIDIAEVPGRYEPGVGEIDFSYLRDVIDQLGWDGTLTFETVPSDGCPETATAAIDDYFPASWA